MHQCTFADQAFDGFIIHKPQWVLLSLDLPGKPGLHLARKMKALDNNVRVVFLTDYNDDDYLNGMRAGGGFDYLLHENIHRLPELLAEETPVT